MAWRVPLATPWWAHEGYGRGAVYAEALHARLPHLEYTTSASTASLTTAAAATTTPAVGRTASHEIV